MLGHASDTNRDESSREAAPQTVNANGRFDTIVYECESKTQDVQPLQDDRRVWGQDAKRMKNAVPRCTWAHRQFQEKVYSRMASLKQLDMSPYRTQEWSPTPQRRASIGKSTNQ